MDDCGAWDKKEYVRCVWLGAACLEGGGEYCYQILQDQRFLRQPVNGCRTTSETDNQLQAAEA